MGKASPGASPTQGQQQPAESSHETIEAQASEDPGLEEESDGSEDGFLTCGRAEHRDQEAMLRSKLGRNETSGDISQPSVQDIPLRLQPPAQVARSSGPSRENSPSLQEPPAIAQHDLGFNLSQKDLPILQGSLSVDQRDPSTGLRGETLPDLQASAIRLIHHVQTTSDPNMQISDSIGSSVDVAEVRRDLEEIAKLLGKAVIEIRDIIQYFDSLKDTFLAQDRQIKNLEQAPPPNQLHALVKNSASWTQDLEKLRDLIVDNARYAQDSAADFVTGAINRLDGRAESFKAEMKQASKKYDARLEELSAHISVIKAETEQKLTLDKAAIQNVAADLKKAVHNLSAEFVAQKTSFSLASPDMEIRNGLKQLAESYTSLRGTTQQAVEKHDKRFDFFKGKIIEVSEHIEKMSHRVQQLEKAMKSISESTAQSASDHNANLKELNALVQSYGHRLWKLERRQSQDRKENQTRSATSEQGHTIPRGTDGDAEQQPKGSVSREASVSREKQESQEV
ncbi:MAG: hypothetical protein Q9213_005462 [Squamulea squamosa]